MVGYSWRSEVLPGSFIRWRVPGWIVGQKGRKTADEFEEMRRRLEGEGDAAAAAATGSDGRLGADMGRRRTLGRQFLDQFSGGS